MSKTTNAPERDELALTLANAQRVRNGSPELSSAEQVSRIALDDADAILAAGYRKPRAVTTPEELDALSNGSSVLCLDAAGEGHPAQKHADGWGLPFSGEFWTSQQILDGCESITVIQEWAS